MASGALESIVINNRRFTCKADDEANIQLSGFHNETIVHGDGSHSTKKIRHIGHLSGFSVNLDDSQGDLEFLQDCQNRLEDFPVTATKVDGTVYSGNMQLIDELDENSGENTVEINLEGDLEMV